MIVNVSIGGIAAAARDRAAALIRRAIATRTAEIEDAVRRKRDAQSRQASPPRDAQRSGG